MADYSKKRIAQTSLIRRFVLSYFTTETLPVEPSYRTVSP